MPPLARFNYDSVDWRYVAEVLGANSLALSRTRHGVSDTSTSAKKLPLLLTGEALKERAAQNEERACQFVFDARKGPDPQNPDEVKALLFGVADRMNEGLLPAGRLRTWPIGEKTVRLGDGPEQMISPAKAPPEEVERAVEQFCAELWRRWGELAVDPVPLAAWAEWELNGGTLHPFYDGCGRISRAFGALLLLRGSLALPLHDSSVKYYRAGNHNVGSFAEYLRQQIAVGQARSVSRADQRANGGVVDPTLVPTHPKATREEQSALTQPLSEDEQKRRQEEIVKLCLQGIELQSQGTAASLVAAAAVYDRAIALFETLPIEKNHHYCHGLARIWSSRGIALESQGTVASLAAAVASFDRAIELMETLPVAENHEYRNNLASAWNNRGNALQSQGAVASLAEAVASFDRAIELREGLPVAENHEYRHGLAQAWMNRGSALQSQGTVASLADAVASYDRAIELMETLPVAENHEYRHSLASAWMNRGSALASQGTVASLAAAVASYDRAIELMETLPIAENHEYRNGLANAWMNRANALQTRGLGGDFAEALESTRRCLALVHDGADSELRFADTRLRGCGVFCRTSILIAQAGKQDAEGLEETLAEAADRADEGMA
ncbi:MAG TPA: hypothetical protein VHH73_01775, partial [Verrucomicrobiae bacterium]|nr:hypothetical protein [Verrucomicrobiae bacterium]